MARDATRRFERSRDGRAYVAEVRLESVLLADDHRHEGGGVRVSHAAFLEGRYPRAFGEALGSGILSEVRGAIGDVRASPEGRAYEALVARWGAVPVDASLRAIHARPDPGGFASAEDGAVVELAVAERGLFEARGRRATFLVAGGEERSLELPAEARAGIAAAERYWLITDRVHAFDASGEPLFDAGALAERFSLGARVVLDGLDRSGARVVVRYAVPATECSDAPLRLVLGARGVFLVDPDAGAIAARFTTREA